MPEALRELPMISLDAGQLVGVDLARCGEPTHALGWVVVEEKRPLECNSPGQFERCPVQHEQVDSGGEQDVERLRRIGAPPCGNVEVGVAAVVATRPAAADEGEDRTSAPQRVADGLDGVSGPGRRHTIIVAQMCAATSEVGLLEFYPTHPSGILLI